MSALFEVEPIVIAGQTDGNRYVQWWADAKLAGMTFKECIAAYNDGLPGEAGLYIRQNCPEDLLIKVLHAYPFWKDGGVTVDATHTVEWVFSKPVFHPVVSGLTRRNTQ